MARLTDSEITAAIAHAEKATITGPARFISLAALRELQKLRRVEEAARDWLSYSADVTGKYELRELTRKVTAIKTALAALEEEEK